MIRAFFCPAAILTAALFALIAVAMVGLSSRAGETAAAVPLVQGADEAPESWKREWPKTDFTRTTIAFGEIVSGGPPKDGIPAIDDPAFRALADITDLAGTEPVIGLFLGKEARAYPLRVLMWHEIVNDRIGGVPVTVTYCPLCNSAIVFDRRLGGRVLDFGTTGKLRKSDLVMYDRQTESWWQQFSGEAIIGEMAGKTLTMIASRLESFAAFKTRATKAGRTARVLVPNNRLSRRYGTNPYAGYDTVPAPFLFSGDLPDGIEPMMRVVVVDGRAWTLPLVRERGEISVKDADGRAVVIRWRAGQNSALDTRAIAEGRDVGNVIVQRETAPGSGVFEDAVHDVTFAFVFYAFHPNGTLQTL